MIPYETITTEERLILEFKEIELNDKPIFDEFFHDGIYHASEACFGTLFIWRGCYETSWVIAHGALIIKVTVNNFTFVMPAFGELVVIYRKCWLN